MKVQSMRILPTLLAGGAVFSALATGPAFADPIPAPAAPAAAPANPPVPNKTTAVTKTTPRIGMLMTAPTVTAPTITAPRTPVRRSISHSSTYANWLPNAADAIRRQ